MKYENADGAYFGTPSDNARARTWVEIDLKAIAHNVAQIKKHIPPETKIMAMVKADAYGHGAVPIAKLLESRDVGIYGFGVASINEAFELRSAGITSPIYIFGYIEPSLSGEVVVNGITPSVFTFESAYELSEAAKRLNTRASCFIKLDTGMTRTGFHDCKESAEVIGRISRLPNLDIAALISHFACADEEDMTSALEQKRRFDAFSALLENEGINIPIKSLYNSAATMQLDSPYDMVRDGIIIYGIYPSDEVRRTIPLVPAMTLKTKVSFVQRVGAGVAISYGGTFVTERESVIATLSAGYADGIPRLISNKGAVLLNGRRAPIVGRICMDQMMVDVTDIPGVSIGDTAVIIGKQSGEEIPVEEIAGAAMTIPYEIICGLARGRVPRIYF